MLPSPQEIMVFLEVAQTLNITKAAQRMGLTQPSLSLSLKKLEHTIGENLIIRSKNGVELTIAGKNFQKQARNLLETWEKIKSETTSSVLEVKGNIKFGCHPSVGLYSLHHFLPHLMQNHPDLEITLVHDLSRKITQKVINYEIDMGLVINPVEHPDLIMTKIFEDTVKLWKAKKDIPDVLICHPELIQTQSILKNLRKGKQKFDRVITSENLEIITQLTLEGCGYGIIPERVLMNLNSKKELHAVPNSPQFKDELHFVFRMENKDIESFKVIKQAIQKLMK